MLENNVIFLLWNKKPSIIFSIVYSLISRLYARGQVNDLQWKSFSKSLKSQKRIFSLLLYQKKLLTCFSLFTKVRKNTSVFTFSHYLGRFSVNFQVVLDYWPKATISWKTNSIGYWLTARTRYNIEMASHT